jgi:hypothetical protein
MEPVRAAESMDPAAEDRLMLALTTEHFTLQTARSATISESAGRAALFLFMVSSGIVALAFAGQSSGLGPAFDLLALTILPVLILLGSLTYLRLVQSAVEDLRLANEIERIRARYREVVPEATRWFRPLLHVDGAGGGGVRHLASHSATMVLIVVSLLAGGAAALAVRAADAGLAMAASAGATATVVTAAAFLSHQALAWRRATRAILLEDPTPSTSPTGNGSRGERFASRPLSRVRHIRG